MRGQSQSGLTMYEKTRQIKNEGIARGRAKLPLFIEEEFVERKGQEMALNKKAKDGAVWEAIKKQRGDQRRMRTERCRRLIVDRNDESESWKNRI